MTNPTGTPVALTIAGSDPSGGAGLQADLKTFHQHGVFGTSVLTLVTAQNTLGVSAIEGLSTELMEQQLNAVLDDLPPAAAKTGALGSAEMIRAVAGHARRFDFPLVVDPVMVSKHGDPLIDENATDTLREELLPHAYLVTPNRHEAARLSGIEVADRDSIVAAAEAIAAMGPEHVLLKAGRDGDEAVDFLFGGGRGHWFRAEWVDSRSLHGTGCVLSAAITARLARGESLASAVMHAKSFVQAAIRDAPALGRGYGPLNLNVRIALV